MDNGRTPTSMLRRFVKAYWVTFQVVFSYLSWQLVGRLMSGARRRDALVERHRVNARRVERTIVELKGMFIKVGQLISIMTNFLPEEFRGGLEGLQDQVPARPFEDIRQSVRDALGADPLEVFADFDRTPVSSASIGQVHLARLKTGERVAVKVQYPDLEQIVAADLKTLRRILRIVELFVGQHGLEVVYREVKEMVERELDFEEEGKALEQIARNFAGDTTVGFPRVYWDLSAKRVLTTEFIDGFKISDLARLDALQIDRRRLAERVVEAYCKQIFVDGVYHADPHPGNLMLVGREMGAQPRIYFLDFGAVASLSPKMREGILEFFQGVFLNDTERIIDAMKAMGFVSRGANHEVFDKVVEYFHRKLSEELPIESLSLREIKIDPKKGLENLADLSKMDISLRDLTTSFHVPKEYVFLERTVLLLLGLCTHLDPEMNPMTIIRPYLERFVLGDRDWAEFLTQTLREGAATYLAIPGELKRYLGRATKGELQMQFVGLDAHVSLLYALGHQFLFAFLGAAATALSLWLQVQGRARDAYWAGMGAVGCGVLLLGSLWANRGKRWKRKDRRRH
ncbi:MAG TPA: AarF/UbiB family protein [Myxococcota bacterium]|nr:AarF/UbiB family protein [Myxococcota bacterium]